MKKREYDVFISHASEDKKSFVDGLATELRKRGLEVWYDKFELNVGDSLTQRIEDGLAKSRFGVIVYSPTFFKKRWTKAELNGLFASEMSGKPRILPIRHNLSVAQLRKHYPIQSDKVSLSSSMPLNELCDAFIRVIRPELLESKHLQAKALDASEVFIKALKTKHPDWDVSLQVLPKADGGVQKSIEYKPITPAAIADQKINVQFKGKGIRKIQDLIRTGKTQTWTQGEFANITSKIPFLPQFTDGSVLTLGPQKSVRTLLVRVECGYGRFELMQMKFIRGGTDEIEFEISADQIPLQMRVVYPLNKKISFTANFSWQVEGFRAPQCKAMIDFVTAAQSGAPIVITDLRGEFPPIHFPVSGAPKAGRPFKAGFVRLVDLCVQIESSFKVKMHIRNAISDDDLQALRILDSLINKTEYDAKLSTSWELVRGASEALDAFVCGESLEQLAIFSPVEDYVGYVELFGTRIPTPLWGIWAICSLDISAKEKERYCSGQSGYRFTVTIRNNDKCRYDWAADHPKLKLTSKIRTTNGRRMKRKNI